VRERNARPSAPAEVLHRLWRLARRGGGGRVAHPRTDVPGAVHLRSHSGDPRSPHVEAPPVIDDDYAFETHHRLEAVVRDVPLGGEMHKGGNSNTAIAAPPEAALQMELTPRMHRTTPSRRL
jgi:hypothetical protein